MMTIGSVPLNAVPCPLPPKSGVKCESKSNLVWTGRPWHVIRSPRIKPSDRVPGAKFLGLIAGDENSYFLRSFDGLGLSETEINAPPAPVTKRFDALMQRVDPIAATPMETFLAKEAAAK